MKHLFVTTCAGMALLMAAMLSYAPQAQESQATTAARIDGTEPGWRSLGPDDFVDVNGEPETWFWEEGVLKTTGKPIGVLRTKQVFTNFELIVEWRHMEFAGNSGVFVWSPMKALRDLPPGELPGYGIEIQMLDHGYAEQYRERTGNEGDWFSTNGDVFAVGNSKLEPFPPLSPNGRRSFPRENHSNGHGEWNHYYVRCINGEVRLWVNGVEVSGGNEADPAQGHLCMEAEGAPVEFRTIRVRELP